MASVETKEELITMLEHIQHYCHEKYFCNKCIFAYEDGLIMKCVFCGIINIDCYPPDEWKLEILHKRMLGGENNGN